MNLLREYIRELLTEEILTLHHRTSPDKAATIRQTGFNSKIKTSFGTEVYFSTKPDGEATGYGSELVSIEIPEQYANLDDEFPDGEQHYWVAAKDLARFGRLLNEANEYGWSTANKKNFMLDKDGMEKSDKKNVHKYLKAMQLMEAARGVADMKNKNIYFAASGSSIEIWLASKRSLDWNRKKSSNLDYTSILNRASVGILSAIKDGSAYPCSGAYVVTWAHVDEEASGFGPLLYDIAMELATEWDSGLAADRNNVSDDAFNVWDYYHKKRGDVTTTQLDDDEGRLTPEDGTDDCYMDAAYNGGDGRYGWWTPHTEEDLENNPWDPDGEEVLRDSPISKVYRSNGTPTLDALDSAGKLIDIHGMFDDVQ